MIESMYQVLRPSISSWVPLRGCQYHVRQWGTPASGTTPIVLAHGWMDVAASYQFMVDALSEAFVQQRSIIAFDWRGYGLAGIWWALSLELVVRGLLFLWRFQSPAWERLRV